MKSEAPAPNTSVSWLPTKIMAVPGWSSQRTRTMVTWMAMSACKSLGKFGKGVKDLVGSFGVPSTHDFVQTYSNKSCRCHLCHGPLRCAFERACPASITGTAIKPQLSPAITVLGLRHMQASLCRPQQKLQVTTNFWPGLSLWGHACFVSLVLLCRKSNKILSSYFLFLYLFRRLSLALLIFTWIPI